MKTQKRIIALTAAAAVSLMVGCEKKTEPQVNETVSTATKQPAAAPAVAPVEANKVGEATKPAVEQAAADVKAASTMTAAEVTTKFNAVVEQAKTLMGQSKYSDALNTLQQVASLKLSAEQEKVLAGLKEQIQKAMASDAAKSVGTLLK